MLSQVSRLLEHSLSSHERDQIDPSAGRSEQREKDIRSLANPAKKAGALAIHRLSGWQPERIRRFQQKLTRRHGIEKIGLGFTADVYLVGGQVLKVFRDTFHMSDDDRHEFIKEHERVVDGLRQGLGDFVLPHLISIGQHPITGEPAVTARQEFIRFNPKDSVFPMLEAPVDMQRLESIERRNPGAVQGLAQFALVSLEHFEETSYLPDTFGPNNLVVGQLGQNAPTPHLIDNVPHRAYGELPNIYRHIEVQLTDLAAAPSRI